MAKLKRTFIGIIICILIAITPVRQGIKDGGSVQYSALLYKVTKYHKMVDSADSMETGHLIGWGVEILGMEIFNNTKYVPDSQSHSESFENISTTYTLQDAKKAEFVCFENSDITEGQQTWDGFLDDVKTKKESSVMLAKYYTLDEERCSSEYYESEKDEYPVLYIQELTYKNSTYTIRWIEEGEMITKTYKYMLRYEGEPNSGTALFDSYVKYVLTNDSTVTWEQIERGMLSSQLGDGIDHYTVYNDWIYKTQMSEE